MPVLLLYGERGAHILWFVLEFPTAVARISMSAAEYMQVFDESETF